MLLIGESLNATRKPVAAAILEHSDVFIRKLARAQVEAGAHLLDVNAGLGTGNEAENLAWLVRVVQDEVSVPLSLDSADPEAIKAAMAVHRGVPLINSITAEPSRLGALLPIITSTKCRVVALCLGESGIPETAEERLEVGRFLVGELERAGVAREDILVDPAVLAVASDSGAPVVTLDTLSLVKRTIAEVQTLAAISNVGFGLPNRSLLNSVFASLAVARGVDALLVDTRDNRVMSSIYAARCLTKQDPYCLEYLSAYRRKLLS